MRFNHWNSVLHPKALALLVGVCLSLPHLLLAQSAPTGGAAGLAPKTAPPAAPEKPTPRPAAGPQDTGASEAPGPAPTTSKAPASSTSPAPPLEEVLSEPLEEEPKSQADEETSEKEDEKQPESPKTRDEAVEPTPNEVAKPTAEPASDEKAIEKNREQRTVKISGRSIYEFQLPFGPKSPEARAESAQAALRQAVDSKDPQTVRLNGHSGYVTVSAGSKSLFNLTADDAKAAGDETLEQHAEVVLARVQSTLESERQRRGIATTIFSASLAALLALAALLLLNKTGAIGNRAQEWIALHREQIRGIQFQSMELVSRATVRNAIALGVEISKWLLRFAILYFWVLVTLLLFDSTRGYAKQLTGFVFGPAYGLTTRVATALPLLVVALFAFSVLLILLRFVDLFFAAVARGETSLAWIPPDLARPTSLLIRGALVVSVVLFGAPIVTGDDSGGASKVVLVFICALGLASTPLLSSLIVGSFIVFSRRLRPGEFVEFGGTSGRVIKVELLEVQLEEADGTELRVPQLLALFHKMRLFGPKPKISVELTVPTVSAALCDKLQKAAQRIGNQASVEILSLDPGAIRLRVRVQSSRPGAKNSLFLALHSATREADVPISSRTPAQQPL